LAVDENGRRNDEGGMAATGGGRLARTLHPLAACSCGAEIRDKPVDCMGVVAAKRLAAGVLNVEHVEHAIVPSVVKVCGYNVCARRAESAAQVSKKAWPVGRGYKHLGRRAAHIDMGGNGDSLSHTLGERRSMTRLCLRGKASP